MTTTTDLGYFGYCELAEAGRLLTALCEPGGRPEDFEFDGVHLMMNQNSGNVFLTNSEHQVAMMNGDDLESFYSCPICGHEGFLGDMAHSETPECKDYLSDIGFPFDS